MRNVCGILAPTGMPEVSSERLRFAAIRHVCGILAAMGVPEVKEQKLRFAAIRNVYGILAPLWAPTGVPEMNSERFRSAPFGPRAYLFPGPFAPSSSSDSFILTTRRT